MGVDLQIILFGDQSEAFIPSLRHLLCVQDNPLLTSFFDTAYSTLRRELAQHPQLAQDFPEFLSVDNLFWRYTESGSRHPAIESVLVCIFQIASLLKYSDDGANSYPRAESSRLVGSCTGLLAAAAVSCSRSYLELVGVSVEVLKVALRIGAEVLAARNELEQAPKSQATWSAIFPGVGRDQAVHALEAFRKSSGVPSTSRPFISATSEKAITISGPPLVLDRLFDSAAIGPNRPIPISTPGPYHAPHLYNDATVSSILECLPEKAEHTWVPHIPIISNDKQETYQAHDLKGLIEKVLGDILLEALHWERVCANSNANILLAGAERCQVLAIGAINAAKSLVAALNQRGEVQARLDDRRPTPDTSQSDDTHGRSKKSKIAICGMSGRFPDAASLSAFWDLLKQGLDVHREIPKDRFDAQAHYDPTGKRKNTSHTLFGCFIEDPGHFDARFFNMSPNEATQTDPMHRLALVTAYEALEMSGYVPNRTPSTMANRIGTFYGQTSDDWREIQDGQKVQTYFIPGGVRAFAPGRINYHFKFSGPSFSVDTACSSSLAAINIACNSLWQHDCDTAVAGGLNVLTNPDIFAGLSRGQFLSKTGNCKTFDDGADGYCRGDGAGTVILKRLEDAEADNDPILAVIMGTGTNHSAEAVSITHPHAGAQEYLFKNILREASVDAHDVSYVEMHGTGTQAGDAIEMSSVLGSFAPADRLRRPDQPLYLGSVKSNVGHGEAASGITALVKVLLMLDHNAIPPHCGIKDKINHNFPDLGARNVHISLGGSTDWNRPEAGKRIFFLNNFSAAGGNTALLMEDAPLHADASLEDHRSVAVVAVSGKTKSTLIRNVENLVEYLAHNPSTSLSSLSYTTTARRMHHSYRTIVAGSDLSTIQANLKKAISSDPVPVSSKPSVVLAFTGQGSHYSGMGKSLFAAFSQFRSNIRRFDSLAKSQGLPSILPLVDGSVEIEDLSPATVQIGAVCVQMALTRLWKSWGIEPAAVIGHSLGEYAALYAAGVLSANDTIFLTGTRAKLLEAHCEMYTHAMLAVSASSTEVAALIDGSALEIACINGPRATVLSGRSEDIDHTREKLSSKGTKCTKLNVPFAFHSAQVDPILEDFEAAANGVTFKAPCMPIISPLISNVISDEGIIDSAYLARHCRDTVNYLGGLEAAKESGVIAEDAVFLEIGSHPICSGMIKSILGASKVAVPSIRRDEDVWKVLGGTFCALHAAGLNINWTNYHQDFRASQYCLRLPSYSWDMTNYWIDYKNDWTLTKGEAPSAHASEPMTLSSTVQRVIDQEFQGQKCTLTTETDIARSDLQETIKGHLVNGIALCSSAVYADMSLTVADYVHRQIEPENDDFAMNCSSMVVDKPLIAKNDPAPQLLRTSSVADLSKGSCEITLYSVNDRGQKTIEHAKCKVLYEDAAKRSLNFGRQQYLVQSQLDRLTKGAETGDLDKIRRRMAYKLFAALVDYQDAYKGMAEIFLDSAKREGTARVELQPIKTGSFFMAPYHIDSLCHLAGFIMNANDELDSAKTVFVNHGWESLRFTQKPMQGETYWSYVKMSPTTPGSRDYSGDVYICDSQGNLVGEFGGLEFQFLPKQMLDRLLPPVRGASTSASKPGPNPQSQTRKRTSRPAESAHTRAATPSLGTRALDVMAQEIGIAPGELADPNNLAELGVDSLMSLNISGKFREELGLEVPSTLFADCQTVKDVKQYMAEQDRNGAQPAGSETASSASSEASGISTPATTEVGSNTQEDGSGKDGDKLTTIVEVIAEETGVPGSEVTSSADLANIGIDSLMSLQILGNLREQHGLDLPTTFFSDHETFGDVEKAIAPSSTQAQSKDSATEETAARISSPSKGEQHVAAPASDPSPKNLGPTPPSATSVLLQGSLKSASEVLFLFPDGSGTAASYAALPAVAPKNLAIVGLNCPFMKTPDAFDCGIEGVASLYLSEVRRRQPRGPYILGGWSAGGICAYEASLQLQAAGEVVEKLLFLDVPCPLPPQALPERLHHFFDSIGLLGPQGQAPDWLIPHFTATIRALSSYTPKSMDPSKVRVPQTFSIMAQDGVCKYETDRRPELTSDDPPHMSWLLFNRTIFGPNGWENLLGGGGNFVALPSVPDVNHFTMMRQPGVSALPSRISQAFDFGKGK